MNILNCCRICLEESAFNTFNFSEYIGNSTIKSLIQQICSNIDVRLSFHQFFEDPEK